METHRRVSPVLQVTTGRGVAAGKHDWHATGFALSKYVPLHVVAAGSKGV
eukprot:CAMPEP_0204601202 /NCGR_PEP_ID=MMETSP0661-20131031/55887_1 /ASSEMBLY_ACC=CAM_ASM_000606 /TAXON_ID=109239 /ORGANISM="Alexandrium margalefi, Strain AMGDE01CS-322" /LENGTH=49 /DNA_ID=CAMNT_0051612049 /DNA_START=152 /DNA_END=301 /DNA_ORIENTATION=+